MAGEQPGLVSAPVERQARFVDELSFAHQPADLVAIAGSFGLPLGGLVVVAAIAQLVVLELEEKSGDLVVEVRRIESARIRPRLCIQRPSERCRFIVERQQERRRVERRVDALVVRGPLEDDRPEQLAGDRARQLVRPELVDDPELLVRDEQEQPEQLRLDRA